MQNLFNSKRFFSLIASLLVFSRLCALEDPLPSWNEGESKKRIIEYVKDVTDEKSSNFISVEDRIATFDEDGTLWVEQPVYTEFMFALESVKALAPQHPQWEGVEPFKTILREGLEGVKGLNQGDIVKLIGSTHAGVTIKEFHSRVNEWLEVAEHPRFKRPFTELVYQPMLEVMQYLKDHQFQVFIVSGGGQEFMRSYTQRLYGLVPGKVIGTAGRVKYEYRDGSPVLFKVPELLYIDDKVGKPEGINLVIGQRPVAAFGNSIGDQQMLEWTQGNSKKTLQLLVHHDDAVREYSYGPDSKVGTFSDALMDEAKKQNWIVVSMKDDWKIIFPWQQPIPVKK